MAEVDLASAGSYSLSLESYPGHYANGTFCEWHIRSAPGCRVYAEFEDFQLAREDYLYVANVSDVKSGMRYTKDQIPPNIVSTNILYLTFTSDEEYSDIGFSVLLSSICDDSSK